MMAWPCLIHWSLKVLLRDIVGRSQVDPHNLIFVSILVTSAPCFIILLIRLRNIVSLHFTGLTLILWVLFWRVACAFGIALFIKLRKHRYKWDHQELLGKSVAPIGLSLGQDASSVFLIMYLQKPDFTLL